MTTAKTVNRSYLAITPISASCRLDLPPVELWRLNADLGAIAGRRYRLPISTEDI